MLATAPRTMKMAMSQGSHHVRWGKKVEVSLVLRARIGSLTPAIWSTTHCCRLSGEHAEENPSTTDRRDPPQGGKPWRA